MSRRAVAVAALAVLAVLEVAALEVPLLERRVTDLAGLFSSTDVAAMESTLATLEQETGAQLAVLTIPGLGGVPIEDYSMRVVETWQLGERGRDNGVLILIARDDRRIRIEVGYGLEGVIPDALAGRIIDRAMTPAFRQGDFAAGTTAAVDVIGAAIRGDPEAGARLDPPRSADETVPGLAAAVIFLAMVGTFAISALVSRGAGAWILYLFLTPFFFAFPGILLGPGWGMALAAAWLIGFPILRALIWHTDAGKRFRTSSSRGGTMWIPSGGSWGGGGFGGGFSGGGGSFGGGGASGGW